jgi:IclR family transcriptional regulator, mhp operon transcriptional activator
VQRNQTKPKEIRALVRGAQVIETLCRVGAGSLADLHRATKLPKATLRRILITYQRMNFIRCSLGDGLYRPNIHIPAYTHTAANPFVGRVVSAAAPVMRELAADVGWPSDLLVREGTRLRIVETNRSLIPIQISPLEIGDHVEMPSSAVGRAYLAFCPKSEREEILNDIARLGGRKMIAGAQGRNRTTDTMIFSHVLYQLSYLGAGPGGVPPGRS